MCIRDSIIRRVSAATFPEAALRAFRAAQFAARLEARIEPETAALCAGIDVFQVSRERVFDEMCKALLKASRPSAFFRELSAMNHLREFFPEIEACMGVAQNPRFHPEGDVFEHTMLVLDCAAELRARAKEPLFFMISALLHDVGTVSYTHLPAQEAGGPATCAGGLSAAHCERGRVANSQSGPVVMEWFRWTLNFFGGRIGDEWTTLFSVPAKARRAGKTRAAWTMGWRSIYRKRPDAPHGEPLRRGAPAGIAAGIPRLRSLPVGDRSCLLYTSAGRTCGQRG